MCKYKSTPDANCHHFVANLNALLAIVAVVAKTAMVENILVIVIISVTIATPETIVH
jgi:hypothetical protein